MRTILKSPSMTRRIDMNTGIFGKIKSLIRDMVLIILFHAMLIMILINQLENAFETENGNRIEFLPKANRVETRKCDQGVDVDEC